MMKNLRIKFIVAFLCIMLISGFCSLIISTIIFSPSIEKESRNSQKKIVDTIIELKDKTEFTLNKIIDLSNKDGYDVEIVSNLFEDINIDYNIPNKEFIQIKKSSIPIVDTILKIDDNYVKISNSFNDRAKHYRAILGGGIALIISIIIATIISGIISKKVLKPIRELNKATYEVAKGNFNIKVDIPRDHEFGLLTRNFNKMVKELNGIETLRSDFVSNVSHEIKTPLASIQGFAKLVQDSSFSDDERSEFAEIIINESARLSKLSSNILKLSKLENQDIITEKTQFSLDEQIRCAILIMEAEWNEKNIELDIELEKVNIIENEDLLQQVWLNLIGNAIKFTSDGGKIKIKLMNFEDEILIKISDNGIGMSEETKKHIFEKFYQGDKAHLSNGNGLGLALVKRIIELCNGRIKVDSKLGEGTTFTIRLNKSVNLIEI
ncbi:sensor histidine kinase [Clostridium mediterraneense]|uniref:sensor histidine kinase n=1 Tax=Clostridium mediterraneense TaxID=1805472 RepID=UPI000A029960|nr:HAMP domain-containing sensor histidine kinase [Clostridium mediterraneense]